mmetsp:Transcript_4433/g.7699  ORF Transcript_4433/g.7699 Transcript_4433/m.7699 type:complete len:212 (-) Transcript_4433:97-732(-)
MLVGVQRKLRVQERVVQINLQRVVEAVKLAGLLLCRAVVNRIRDSYHRDLVQSLLETREKPAQLSGLHSYAHGIQVEIDFSMQSVGVDEIELELLLQSVLAVDEDDHLVFSREDLEDRSTDALGLQGRHEGFGENTRRENGLLEQLVHVKAGAAESQADVRRPGLVHASQVQATRAGFYNGLRTKLAQRLNTQLKRPQLLLCSYDTKRHRF